MKSLVPGPSGNTNIVYYPRWGDCAYSHISFIRECTNARDVSYVTGEGVELMVHNESVVVEEIKKVDV